MGEQRYICLCPKCDQQPLMGRTPRCGVCDELLFAAAVLPLDDPELKGLVEAVVAFKIAGWPARERLIDTLAALTTAYPSLASPETAE